MSNRIFKNPRTSEKEGLIDRIEAEMRIPQEGVYCFFDGQVYMDYDIYVDDDYKRLLGFHRYTGNKEGIHGDHPGDIYKIMERNNCDHLIWMSKKICDADDVHFSWIYVHELQHLLNYIENPDLYNLSRFLCDTYSGIDGRRWPCEVPDEFYCDQKAKMIVEIIYGAERRDECMRRVFTEQEEYIKFKEIEALMPFSIEDETIRIICEHKDQFKQYTDDLGKYDIDIDSICAKCSARKTLNFKT
jgi:hypothetical protein